MNFLKETIFINYIKDLKEAYPDGTLIVSSEQSVIDNCLKRKIPVAGLETDGKKLNCEQILIDIDEIEDEDLERIYRRAAGIVWDIAVTDRCFIRELSLDDIDDLFDLYAQPGVTEFMEPLFEYDREKEYEENYINYIYKIYGFGMWLVFDKITGELIGRAGIEVRDTCEKEKQAELGFMIAPSHWQKGYATEVCTCIMRLAKEEFCLTSLIARCDPKNAASIALLKKLGFGFEKYLDDGDCFFTIDLKEAQI